MKLKMIVSVLILYIITLLNCSDSTSPKIKEENILKIVHSNLEDNSILPVTYSIYFSFNDSIPVNNFAPDSIVQLNDIYILFNCKNIVIDGHTSLIYYHPKTSTIAFIEETTIPQPDGTGLGSLPGFGNHYIKISNELVSKNDKILKEDIIYNFTVKDTLQNLKNVSVSPNPFQEDEHNKHLFFIYVPDSSLIEIYDYQDNFIYSTIYNNNSNRKWNIKDFQYNRVSSGIYKYYVTYQELKFKYGVIAISH